MLGGIYRPAEVRFHVRKMAEDRGGIFIEDKVIQIDPVEKVGTSNPASRYDMRRSPSIREVRFRQDLCSPGIWKVSFR